MKCFMCQGNMEDSRTNHVVNMGNTVIIVRNVPCEKCLECGDEYYSDEVATQLDKIVSQVNTLVQEVAILEYREIAS